MNTPVTICGIDELHEHAETGVSHVLSILDPDYPVPEAFGTYGEHAKLELRFHDVIDPGPGVQPPEPEHVERLLAFGRDLAESGGHLLVHCHAGVSRSTAATLLIAAETSPTLSSEDLARTLLGVRRKAWPNLRMVEFGDAQLGRDGALVAAAARIYAEQLSRRPELVEFMVGAGREREVSLGASV